MSTAVMFSSRKWRRMAMALQPQQLSSSMVTPGANRGRAGHKQHLGGGAEGSKPRTLMEPRSPPSSREPVLAASPTPSLKASLAKLSSPFPRPRLIRPLDNT